MTSARMFLTIRDSTGLETRPGRSFPASTTSVGWEHFSPRLGLRLRVRGHRGAARLLRQVLRQQRHRQLEVAAAQPPDLLLRELGRLPMGRGSRYYTFDYGEPVLDPNLKLPETDQLHARLRASAGPQHVARNPGRLQRHQEPHRLGDPRRRRLRDASVGQSDHRRAAADRKHHRAADDSQGQPAG